MPTGWGGIGPPPRMHWPTTARPGRSRPSWSTNLELRGKVEADLAKKYSPEQIAGRLKVEFPDQPEMQVSTETIYQSLYVQSRGALKHQLTRYLRTGRAVRRPSRKVGQRKNRIPNMINIAERPAEAEDRAVPGHWEGNLIIGRKNLAIGTLVEPPTNYRCCSTCPTVTPPSSCGMRWRPRSRPCPTCCGLADLGPGTGDGQVETGQRGHRDRHLLLRPARAVAARHQREHQRPTSPVLSDLYVVQRWRSRVSCP